MSETYITCEEVITFLLGYLEGELPPEQVHEFERHLAVCPSCVSYIETYRTTVELGRAAYAPRAPSPPENGAGTGREAASDDIPDELTRAILAARHAADPATD